MPKPDFLTPGAVKQLAAHFGQTLTKDTGIPWKLHGVASNVRKVIEGREAYYSARFYPEDKGKPFGAELALSVTSNPHFPAETKYTASVVVDRATRTVYEASISPKSVAEMTEWVGSIKLPPNAAESLKAASTLVERVVLRYVESSRTR
jgi:hypothetical protein